LSEKKVLSSSSPTILSSSYDYGKFCPFFCSFWRVWVFILKIGSSRVIEEILKASLGCSLFV
jgi:hypothetical protein